jgi:radical SAM superfamily enzyme YgiQ (UPF0313 family)
MKVFLGDVEHTWEKANIWTFPLNVGYVAEYARKSLPGLDVRLFKRPEEMTRAIRAESPDVVGAGFYVWNSHLANHVLGVAKRHRPDTLTVGGGPHFTSSNADEQTARRFFGGIGSHCDVFVVNQGESGFAELLRTLRDCDGDLDALRARAIRGCLVNNLAGNGRVHVGEPAPAPADLDDIPSPYLSGLMDEFFDGPFAPVVETNRSCPYRCTFCAWGIGTQKLTRYSDARLRAEIEYISQRCRNTGILYIADANFGILDRDADLASHLHACSVRHGYPKNVIASWNKTRPDRVLKAARNLRGLGRIGASMQSLHEPTLAAIKRRNLPLATVRDMVAELGGHGMQLFSELVLGLPLETKQTHLDANRALMDLGAEIFNYNLHLLPGTELDGDDSRAAYVRRVGWRLYDGGYGVYDGERIIEGEEGVIETSTMCQDDLRAFRFIHFLIQFMWSKEWFRDYLMLLKAAGTHPIDAIQAVATACHGDRGAIGEVTARFRADHELETFPDFASLRDYWTGDAPFARLHSGDYGKLNYVYSQAILLDHLDAFCALLQAVATALPHPAPVADAASFPHMVADVLRFARMRRVELRPGEPIVACRQARFEFDVLAWRQSGHAGAPHRVDGGVAYDFALPPSERDFLQTQLDQFRSHNENMTMRKVSEGIAPDRLMYRVRAAG